MKGQFLTLGLASLLTAMYAATQLTPGTFTPVAQAAPAGEMKGHQMSESSAKLGVFVKGEHETKGSAKIILQDGKQFLEFDQAFKTQKGPDLYVILYRQPQVPISGIKEKDYVSLGRLQKITGTQRYAIPQTVKLADFSNAVVWCRRFNATFAYAKLK